MTKGADRPPSGFAVEIVSEAARRRGINLQWVSLERDPAAALARGTIDLYPALAHAPDRPDLVHLSSPWWEANLALIVDKRRGLKSPDQMAGLRIAFVDRSISADLAKQMFPRSEYVRKTPYEDVLRAACAGEADAAFLTVGLYVTLLQQHVDGCESTPL